MDSGGWIKSLLWESPAGLSDGFCRKSQGSDGQGVCWLLSHRCDKMPDKNQLKEGFVWALKFEGAVYHGRKPWQLLTLCPQ